MLSGKQNNTSTIDNELYLIRKKIIEKKIHHLPSSAKHFFQDPENKDILVACFSNDVEYFKTHVEKRHHHQQLLTLALFAECSNVAKYLFQTSYQHKQLPVFNPTTEGNDCIEAYFELAIRAGFLDPILYAYGTGCVTVTSQHLESAKKYKYNFADCDNEEIIDYLAPRVHDFVSTNPDILAIGKIFIDFLNHLPPKASPAPVNFFNRSMPQIVNDIIATGNLKRLKDILNNNPELRSTLDSESLTAAIKSGSYAMVEYLLDPRNEFNIIITQKHVYDARDADPFDGLPTLLYAAQKCWQAITCFASPNVQAYFTTIEGHFKNAAEASLDTVHRTMDYLATKYANDHGKIFLLSRFEWGKNSPYPALQDAITNKNQKINRDLEIVTQSMRALK